MKCGCMFILCHVEVSSAPPAVSLSKLVSSVHKIQVEILMPKNCFPELYFKDIEHKCAANITSRGQWQWCAGRKN